jgi:predicted DNA-binding transcriptional regulator AlpA
MDYKPVDPLLTAEQASCEVGLSLPGFWKAVSVGRIPAPLYPASRAPRWRRSELHAAIDSTRCLPAEAKEKRRKIKIDQAPTCSNRGGGKR